MRRLLYHKDMISKFPLRKLVFFSPLKIFSITPDIVLWSDWKVMLSEWNWINLGTRPGHFTSDARAIIHWTEPLRGRVADFPPPLPGHIEPK